MSFFLMPRVQKRIHYRRDKQSHKKADGQAAYKSLAYWLNSLRAGSGEKGDGDHGEDRCETRHHNGAEPVTARLKTRFAQFQAARPQGICIVNQHYAVVYNHADQGDNAHY